MVILHRDSRWIFALFKFFFINPLSLVSVTSFDTIQPDIVYRRKGDILLGGLFPLHTYNEAKRYCDAIRDLSALKNLEGMIYAVDRINAQDNLLSNITLGFEIYDSCFDFAVTIARSLNFLPRKRAFDCAIQDITDGDDTNQCQKLRDYGQLTGVIGAQRSECTIEAAMLLGTDAIPVVSYLSTSDELSNRDKYPYFMRTVPPDKLQVKVIRDIVLLYEWSFVNFLYSDDSYGQTAFRDFTSEEENYDFCISFSQEISSYWTASDFTDLVRTLRTDPYSRAKVVILFMYMEQAKSLMEAVQRENAIYDFTWVVSDGIAVDGVRALTGVEDVAAGTLAVIPFSNRLVEFDLQFYTKEYKDDPNPWGEEFQHYYCSNNLFCPSNNTEHVADYSTTDTLVMDSVYAFAYAMDEMSKDLCTNTTEPKMCLLTAVSNGSLLYSYLRHVRFVSLANGIVTFDEKGDAGGKYSIENYQLDVDGVLRRTRVGTWTDLLPDAVRLNIDDTLVKFYLNTTVNGSVSYDPPMSVCSEPCAMGLVKTFYSDKLCCWECNECLPNETLLNSTTCSACEYDTWPNLNKTSCVTTVKIFFEDAQGLGWMMISLSCLGILLASINIVGILLNLKHYLIRAMEPVLTVSMFVGIILALVSTAMHTLTPHPAVCFFLRMGLGVSLTLIYVPFAIKTIRCYRTYKMAKKTGSREEADLWNRKKQVLLITVAIVAQLIICTAWMVTTPLDFIRTISYSESGEVYHHDACVVPYFQPIGDIVFNAIFMTVGCVFSILARALPDNNYEIRLFAFSLFGTEILFFSVTVPYFTTTSDYRSLLYVATGLNINSIFVLFCVFSPKLYIACFGSDKSEPEAEEDTAGPIQSGMQGVYRPRLKSRSSSLSLAGNIRTRSRAAMVTVKEVEISEFSSI